MSSIVVSIIIVLIFNLRFYFYARKKFRTTPSLNESRVWKIDETGIEIKGASFSSQFAWNLVVKVKANSKWVIIYFGKVDFVSFPKDLITQIEFDNVGKLLVSKRISHF
jgi:hypothetical protein